MEDETKYYEILDLATKMKSTTIENMKKKLGIRQPNKILKVFKRITEKRTEKKESKDLIVFLDDVRKMKNERKK